MERLKEYAETERQNALTIGDAAAYFDLCDKLGIQRKDAENPKLYDAGRQPKLDFSGGLENAITEEDITPVAKKLNRRVKLETYLTFLEEAEKMDSNNVSDMRKKLFKYFPYRFGPYGKTPLQDMSDSQVMGTFYGHVKYAERRKAEQNI